MKSQNLKYGKIHRRMPNREKRKINTGRKEGSSETV
jgi:hypothetical protein